MGQQVSKDIRSRLEHQTLEELLIDDKYVEELEQHLPWLPKPSLNKLAKIIASSENALSKDSNSRSQPNQPSNGCSSLVKNTNSRSYKLGPLWSIQSQDINIPQNVAEVLKRDHRNLLRQSSKNGIDLQSPSDYYEYTCNVETDRILFKILWRFLTTFYYDLISELDATKNLLSKTQNGGVAFVVAVICQSGNHDRDIVLGKVIGWATIGRRYRGLMDALCSGCLFLFPEKISDLVWEMYVPVKGSTFAKVTRFLRELGIVCKCEEEGWNDLSDQILQTLREPFRKFIPFQFQPNQQSRLICDSNPPPASVPGNDDLRRCEGSILSRDREQEVQDIGVDKLFSGSIPDSRASSRLTTHRVIKTKRKQGATSVRRQLRSFAGDIVLHQAPGSEKTLPVACHTYDVSRAHRSETRLRCQFPQAPTEYRIFAPEDPGQWHVSSQLSINDRERDPPTEIPSNSADHDVDLQQRTGQSITDTLEPERTGFGRISALLNHDINTPAIRVIQFEKHTIQQIVLERPADILGEVWFGSPPGFVPFVSLRLSGVLRDIIKLSGREVLMPEPSRDTSGTFTGVYSIELECFRQLITRDGFGAIFWNEYGGDAFVAMQVMDKELIAAFIQASQNTISVLPKLDNITTVNAV